MKKKNEHHELTQLIATCAKHRVDEICLNDGGITSVKFFAPESAKNKVVSGETVPTVDLAELEANAKKAEANNQSLRDEADLEQLKIDNPEAYEQALVEREMNDSGSGSDSGADDDEG